MEITGHAARRMLDAIQARTRLGDIGTNRVWFVSIGQPAGCDLIPAAGAELMLPGDICYRGDGSPWWDLKGTIADGIWEWYGDGKVLDSRGNTVLRIVAFLPEESP